MSKSAGIEKALAKEKFQGSFGRLKSLIEGASPDTTAVWVEHLKGELHRTEIDLYEFLKLK